jgi:hypothetical protein
LYSATANRVVGPRRYFEIVKKLANKDFNQKFRRNSFDERLLAKMEDQADEVSAPLRAPVNTADRGR